MGMQCACVCGINWIYRLVHTLNHRKRTSTAKRGEEGEKAERKGVRKSVNDKASECMRERSYECDEWE